MACLEYPDMFGKNVKMYSHHESIQDDLQECWRYEEEEKTLAKLYISTGNCPGHASQKERKKCFFLWSTTVHIVMVGGGGGALV